MKYSFFVVFAIFAAAELASSSPIENEAQMVLTTRLDGLQSKLDQLVNQLEQEKILRGTLQSRNAELEKKILQLIADNNRQTEIFEAKIDLLMTQNAQQDKEIYLLKSKINKDTGHIIQPKSSLNNGNASDDVKSDKSSPRLPPSSCRQLSTIGHYLDGIYLVANPETNNIETAYCEFGTSTLSETLYGNVDVKSKSVHFFVQRSSDFSLAGVVIPFDVERLNVGVGMNLATGIFTVPVDGIYHFEFSGMKDIASTSDLVISLRVNGVIIGTSYAQGLANFMTLNGISASLRLNIGDQVSLYIDRGILNDSGPFTHFTGWLVEEELVLMA